MPHRRLRAAALSPAGQELVRRFESFFARMEEARSALRAGQVPDLAAVRSLLDEILAGFRSLPEGEGPLFEPFMLGLVVEVRELGRALGDALESTREELAGLDERARAVRAYGRLRSGGGRG